MNRYLEIFTDIEKQISEGIYPAGSLLPSEKKLAQYYQVSRETIRKALVLLLENGYIQKKQGKGSIVLDIDKFEIMVSGLTSYKELTQNQYIQNQTTLHLLEKGCYKSILNEHFVFPKEMELWKLVRVRQINDESVILDKDFLLCSIVPNLIAETALDSIYQYIEDTLNLTIGYAQKEITVEPITEEDKQLLDLNKGDTHVVVIRSQVYLEDTTLFQHTESRHRMDKFRFVDFARRRRL